MGDTDRERCTNLGCTWNYQLIDCRRKKKRRRQGKERKGNNGRENGVKRVGIKIELEKSKKTSLLEK